MRVTLFTVALVAAITSVTSPRVASALTKDEIACEDAVLQSSQDFVSDKLKALVDCHDKGNCDDGGKSGRQIQKATARLTRALNRICRGVTLENLGFPGSCPTGGGSFTTDELGSCLGTELESFVDAAIALAYPNGGTGLSGDEDKCQNVIGGESRLFINRKMRARTRCLDLQLKGKLSDTINCLAEVPPGTGNRDTDQLIQKAFKQLEDKLRRGCRNADLETIGFPGSCPATGGFSLGDLQSCLETSLETALDQAILLLVPFTSPVATATPTPEETATPSEAPTPTETASLGPPTASPPPGETPTPTETASPGPGEPTATATVAEVTPTPAETLATIEPTPTGTPVASGEPTATATAAAGATPTETAAAGATPTETAAATAEPTPVPTDTTGPVPTSTPSGGACATEITFLANGQAADLDTGWTGQSHDSKVISDGLITATLSNCANASEPCGICSVNGPIPNAGGTTVTNPSNNRRCTGDTAVACSSDGDCTGLGTCQFFFGAPLPLSSGGVSVCVVNQVNGALTGTVDTVSGDSSNSAKLISHIFTGPTTDQPCPTCGTGAFGTTGTCSGGTHPGAACTVNGTSALFGATSYDCPPLVGANVANLSIPLNLTTGLQTRTLGADNPNCTAVGFTTAKCFCDTCASQAAEACNTNADCAAGVVCGGLRCKGGANVGLACTTVADCPGSACGRQGLSTAPNQCDDATCSPNPSDTDSVNEGVCNAGPFEQFCAIQTFRGCATNTDCTATGDTCTFGKLRECFTDNGVSGNAVQVQGSPDPFVGGVSNGTLGTFFCVGPTTAPAVNSVAGLPGLGRLTLPGTATLLP